MFAYVWRSELMFNILYNSLCCFSLLFIFALCHYAISNSCQWTACFTRRGLERIDANNNKIAGIPLAGLFSIDGQSNCQIVNRVAVGRCVHCQSSCPPKIKIDAITLRIRCGSIETQTVHMVTSIEHCHTHTTDSFRVFWISDVSHLSGIRCMLVSHTR